MGVSAQGENIWNIRGVGVLGFKLGFQYGINIKAILKEPGSLKTCEDMRM